MELFIKKIFTYLFFITVVVIALFYKLKPRWNVGYEVQECMDLLTHLDNNQKIDTFRIGDSVGKNLIGTNIDNKTLNLGSNQAISILGQLLLFNKFHLSHNALDSRIVFEGYVKPETFFNNLNQIWTFNYFIKYFYNDDWFFNSDLLSVSSQKNIDNIFLNKYGNKNLIKGSYWNGFSLLTYPRFGNDSIIQNSIKSNLIEIIDCVDLKNFKEKISFKSMPVSRRFFKYENNSYQKLKKLGFKIQPPFVINDSFFIEDGIHLKSKFRNFEFYKNFTHMSKINH